MTEHDDWPDLPDDTDPPRYSPYMTRDEARAVLEAHLDPLRPFAEHPDPQIRALVTERTASAEAAFRRIDGFYETGALPRHPDLPDDALEEIKARNKPGAPPEPSLWSRLFGAKG